MKRKLNPRSAFFNPRFTIALVLCLTGVFIAFGAGGISSSGVKARPESGVHSIATPQLVPLVKASLDKDLRKLPHVAPKPEFEEDRLMRYPHNSTAPQQFDPPGSRMIKRLLQAPSIPGPLLTFDGINSATSGCGCLPPDTNGDVGPNHYIEAVNSSFSIYNKSGTLLAGPTNYDALFAPLGPGTPCGEGANDGDPFAMYDHMADRWVVTDFAFPSFPGSSFYECVAVSKTSDPVSGGWWLYAFQIDAANPTYLGDYPKFGLWPDAYYFSVNLFASPTSFNGVRVFALNRANMINGTAAPAVAFSLTPAQLGDGYSLVAATFRGVTGAPPAGTAEYFLNIDSPANGGVILNHVRAWRFHVDFPNPGNSTFTGPVDISVNNFTDAFTDAGTRLVPQPGTTVLLDTLGDKIMSPVMYTNFGGLESLWAVHTVNNNQGGTGPMAVNWHQFNVTGGVIPAAAAQQQIFNGNSDGVFRWMPSIAVDSSGNMAIGYSAGNASIFPSIRYAGRLSSDPPNTLGQGEASMWSGGGSQTHSAARWGDYTNLAIDPADGISFWHVNEYLPVTSTAAWFTRIGKFQFGAGPTPTPTPTPTTTPTPTPTPACTPWAIGTTLPVTLVRSAGVYFPANGKFYAMGGRTADGAGNELTTPLEYNPGTGTYTPKSATFPDNQTNNIACGVLTESGTPYIYCVGGSAGGATTATGRVFRYNPVADAISTVAAPWPGVGAATDVLPGGFAVFQNKLYIIGGFEINVAMTNQIWEFDPGTTSWRQKSALLPVSRGYVPAATIGSHIYTGGGSDYTGGTLVDAADSFAYDPVADTIAAIPSIPRATGETRALNVGGKMWVLGGGRTTPNPSAEVDIFDPMSSTWSMGFAFNNARRNFPTDTDGTKIWLAGGYDSTGTTPLNITELFGGACATLVTNAVSRKTHNAAGAFDINLPLSGTPGVEGRSGGGTNDFTMVVTFAGNVLVTGSPQAQVLSGVGMIGTGGVANGGTVTVSGNVVTIPLTNVTDQQTINVRLNGVNGAADQVTADITIPMSRLLGDVDGSRSVNSSDIANTKARSGQPITSSNFRSDIDESGSVGTNDVAMVKANAGHGVP